MTTHVIDLCDLFCCIVAGQKQPALESNIQKIFENYVEKNKNNLPSKIIFLFHLDYSSKLHFIPSYVFDQFTKKFANLGIHDLVFTASVYGLENRKDLQEFNVAYFDPHIINLDYYNPNRKIPCRNRYQNKFLLMVGKPHKINRIGLLAELWKENLVNDKSSVITVIKSLLNSSLKDFILSDIDFEKFIADIKQCQDADNYQIQDWDNLTFNHFDLAQELFESVKFSIVTETEFDGDSPTFITEKTFRAIINKHPFLIAGNVGTLQRLKDIGFRTFEQYLAIPEYDKIVDSKQRLNAIVQNVKYLLEHDLSIEMLADVEHNFFRVQEYINETWKSFEIFSKEHDLSVNNKEEIHNMFYGRYNQLYNNSQELLRLKKENIDLINYYDDVENWNNFYNSVRGDDWPKYCSFEQRSNLPNWIQKEIKKFQNL